MEGFNNQRSGWRSGNNLEHNRELFAIRFDLRTSRIGFESGQFERMEPELESEAFQSFVIRPSLEMEPMDASANLGVDRVFDAIDLLLDMRISVVFHQINRVRRFQCVD